jgi:hypothetical protein
LEKDSTSTAAALVLLFLSFSLLFPFFSERGHIEEAALGLARLHGGEKKGGKNYAADPRKDQESDSK